MPQQTQPIQIAGLPLALTFYSNGCISLQPMGQFNVIFDQQEGIDENVVISYDELLISGKAFMYNVFTELKYEPLLKSWLTRQNMQSPI
jgi:hypothetical protein